MHDTPAPRPRQDPDPPSPISPAAQRLRALAERVAGCIGSDCAIAEELHGLIAEVIAAEDRIAYVECAIHHLRDALERVGVTL